MLLRYFLFLMTALKYFQEIQFSLRVDMLLHLIIILLNSLLEKDAQINVGSNGIFSKISEFIC